MLKKIFTIFLILFLLFIPFAPSFVSPAFATEIEPSPIPCIVFTLEDQQGNILALTDGQGNIRMLTDSTGAIVKSYAYDPYGNVRGTSGTGSSNYQFSGEQLDPESGLYFLRARYYDPTTGRFISKDPIKGTLTNPQSQNPYAYVGNNPINRADPSGRQYTVYGGFDAQGTLQYVGQTCRNLAVRAAEHIASGDAVKSVLNYQPLHEGISSLTTAKGSEQTYIDTYGLAKNGGQLVNQINSISPNNPSLNQAKDQAILSGAVPAAAATIGQVLTSVAAGLVSPLILLIDPTGMLNPNTGSTTQL